MRELIVDRCVGGRDLRLAACLMGLASIALVFMPVSPASAAVAAAPAWSVQAGPLPTSFSEADNGRCEARSGSADFCDHYTLVPTNVGSKFAEGAITVVDELPAGVTTIGTPGGENLFMRWVCSEETPATREIVRCASEFFGEAKVPPLAATAEVNISVGLAPSATGTLTSNIEVSGGEAPTITRTEEVSTGETPEFEPLGFETALLNEAGGVSRQAAEHPGAFISSLYFPTAFTTMRGFPEHPNATEAVKQIVVDLPAGVVGDAQSAATCSLVDVANLKENQKQCPSDSRIGGLALISPAGTNTELTIFNVEPEHGYAAEFAVFLPLLNRAEMLYAKLVGSGASAHARVISAPQNSVGEEVGLSLTFFGDPAAINGAGATRTAFFTNPSNCAAGGFPTTIYVDSWQAPGRLDANGSPDLSDPNWKRATSTSPPVTGCELLHFQPTLTLAPEAAHSGADEPAGYESVLRVPQNEDPNGLATPPLKSTVVTLPPGVAISPAAGSGLVGCALGSSGIGLEDEAERDQPGHCPEQSKVGEAEATTPLLKSPLTGGVYVAQPSCGGTSQPACTEAAAESGEVFSIYLELANAGAGAYVKLKGKIEVGGSGHRNGLEPGQVRTTFAETPQEPVEELSLKFSRGPRAPLANPQSCGTQTTTAELEPWSHAPAPGENVGTPNAIVSSAFSINGCEDRFAPVLTGGSVNPQAGAYSPLTLTISRHDREQDLSGLSVQMPSGVTGRIAGVPECGEAEANAGSCPASSRIGSATAAAGSGTEPLWQTGSVYFTGPYKGAPFGLSVVVPAKAGPYNLGNIVVRAALSIDPRTAQVSVVSDPLPQSVDGIPLRVKAVNVTINREAFTLNPTNCGEQALDATVTSAQGTAVPLSYRFEAANCAGLKFTPSLAVTTGGQTSKANGASLSFKISYPAGAVGSQAWLKGTKFEIPKILPARLTTLQQGCLASVFEANPAACPAAALIGHAVVHTPLLPVPLVGPVYFVSHGGAKFPDAVIVLQGDGVTVDLTGETFIDKKTGITSATFRTIPDVPFETAEVILPTGPFSEFSATLPPSAHGSLCGQKLTLPAVFTGQSGAEVHDSTPIAVTGCSTRLSIASHSKKAQTLTIVVYAPAAGRLKVSGKGVVSSSRVAKGQENVTLRLRITKHGKHKIKLTFAPAHGAKQSVGLTARL